ncbi:hypothetical protein ACA910_011285 [Epithemia clementina (nom. ined.)]
MLSKDSVSPAPSTSFSRLSAGSSSDPDYPPTFRTTSKQPKKVIIDPTTGLYRPMKNQEEKKAPVTWDGFKSLVYEGVDILTTKVPESIQKIQGKIPDVTTEVAAPTGAEGTHSSGRRMGLSNIASPSSRDRLTGGYKEREEEFINSLKDVPVKRLTKEFRVPDSVNGRSNVDGDDVLIESSPFDTLKALVYRGIDAVSSSSSDSDDGFLTKPSSPMNRLPSSMQTREMQARLLASDEEFLQAMEELQSTNAVIRLAAGYKVRRMVEQDEILKKRRMRAAQREEQLLAIKSGLYKAGDALVGGVKALVELPPKVAETYENTVVGTRRTIEAAQAFPDQVKEQVESVQQKVGEVQQNVKKQVETTKEIIDKTKQLPSEIKTKVQETRASVEQKAKQTREVIEVIGEKAQDLATTSRVLLGLEKPVPKPPKALPSKEIQEELSVARLGWKALAVTGSLAGKVTWALGKETAKLAWKGGEFAFAIGMEAIEEAAKKDQQRRALAAAAFRPSSTTNGANNATDIINATIISKEEAVKGKPVATKEKKIAKAAAPTPSIFLNKNVKRKGPSKKAPSVKESPAEEVVLSTQLHTEDKAVMTLEQKEKENPRSSERLAKRKEELEMSVLDLEQEIAEALRLAEVAIESAKAELDNVDDDEEDARKSSSKN